MIGYSQHARERMDERGITEDQIALCLRDPDRIEPDDRAGRIRYLRFVPGHTRWIRVIVRTDQRNYVITAHPDKRFRGPNV
jgi:hypothetical protein